IGLVGVFLLINSLYLFLLRLHIFNTHFALQVFLLSVFLLIMSAKLPRQAKVAAVSLLVVLTAGLNTRWFLPKLKADTKVPAWYHLPANLVNTLTSTNGQYRVSIEDEAVPVNIGNAYPVQTIGGYEGTIYAPY